MKFQFSLKRLLASTTLLAIGAVLIAILSRPGYDLRWTVTPFIIAAAAGFFVCGAIALLLRWPFRVWIVWACFGAMAGAFILVCSLLETHVREL